MDDLVLLVLAVGGTFALLLVVAWAVRGYSRRLSGRWEAFARQHNLAYQPQGFETRHSGITFSAILPYAEGTYRNRFIRIGFPMEPGMSRSGWYLRIEVGVNNSANRLLALANKRQFSGAVNQAGLPDVKVSHGPINKRFKVKSAPEGFVASLFAAQSDLGDVLAGLRVKNNAIELVGNTLYYVEDPVERQLASDPEVAFARVDLLCALAEAIEQQR